MPNKYDYALGVRVRVLRRAKWLTLDDLAAATDVSKGFLSGIENCKNQPTAPVLYRLSIALGCSVDYLIFGGEIPHGRL